MWLLIVRPFQINQLGSISLLMVKVLDNKIIYLVTLLELPLTDINLFYVSMYASGNFEQLK